MDGRNKKFCDQKGQEPKGFRQAKNQPKKILPLVKKTISNVYGRQKKQRKNNNNNNYQINLQKQ